MPIRRPATIFIAVLIGFAVGSCERAKQADPGEPEPLFIHFAVGGIWNPGYSLQVGYDRVVIESQRCPLAKGKPPDGLDRKGFCVVRISAKQWEDFVSAAEPYRRGAIPFDPSKILEAKIPMPDGKPCKNEATDHNVIGITWFDQNGASYAGYYEGCDSEEFASFYNQLRSVPLALPIRQMIEDD